MHGPAVSFERVGSDVRETFRQVKENEKKKGT